VYDYRLILSKGEVLFIIYILFWESIVNNWWTPVKH